MKAKYLPFALQGLVLMLLCVSCSVLQDQSGTKAVIRLLEEDDVLAGHFTGLMVYDPAKDRVLVDHNSKKLFTPASNTKIFTYYIALQSLPDTLTELYYRLHNDTLYFTGNANPVFLHRDFPMQRGYEFLKSQDSAITLVYVPRPILSKFGSGWAWDDYSYDFQPEMSSFPLYGNVVTLGVNFGRYEMFPAFFRSFTEIRNESFYIDRDERFNVFYTDTEIPKKRQIPFITSDELTASLLADTLNRRVLIKRNVPLPTAKFVKGVPAEAVYRYMMKRSDNLFAEQLIHMSAYNLADNTRLVPIIQNIDQYVSFPAPYPKWVDGSGLSRYNLISPEALVLVLRLLLQSEGLDKLQRVFPVGGVDGTLKNFYKADTPYVIAKTGTLSNNHNLSGYLLTDSGRILVFSFMNNHHLADSKEIKMRMEKILLILKKSY